MLKTTKLIGKQSYSSVEQSISQKSYRANKDRKRNPESNSTPNDVGNITPKVELDHQKEMKEMNRALKEIGKRSSLISQTALTPCTELPRSFQV